LIGTRTHFWYTHEEQLASALAKDGHHVALMYVETHS
jgi:hypothetical protein